MKKFIVLSLLFSCIMTSVAQAMASKTTKAIARCFAASPLIISYGTVAIIYYGHVRGVNARNMEYQKEQDYKRELEKELLCEHAMRAYEQEQQVLIFKDIQLYARETANDCKNNRTPCFDYTVLPPKDKTLFCRELDEEGLRRGKPRCSCLLEDLQAAQVQQDITNNSK